VECGDATPDSAPKSVDPRETTELGSSRATEADAVEAALAKALEGATAAAEWAVVAQLARELEARRLARASTNVISIAARTRK
jgi:hypothetical protein